MSKVPGLALVLRLLVSVLLLALSACGEIGYGAQEHEPRVPVYHRVQPGETVWAISRRYRVSDDSVMLLNGISDPSQLQVGSRILVGYRYGASRESSADSAVRTASDGPRESRRATQAATSTAARAPSPRQNGDLWWPVSSGRIVSVFGPRSGTFHDGLDISCPEGTPVYASHSGVVVYAGNKLGGYGNLIVLRHATGLTTVYAHNSVLFVSTGDKVRRGENISRVGSTGHASGPHLHFEVRTRDQMERYVAVDPLPLLNGEADARPRYRVNEGLAPIIARLFQ